MKIDHSAAIDLYEVLPGDEPELAEYLHDVFPPDPWQPFQALAIERIVQALQQRYGMEFCYGFPPWKVQPGSAPIDSRQLINLFHRLSADSTDPIETRIPIIGQGVGARFMSGAEQFALRIAKRPNYLVYKADSSILRDRNTQHFLAKYYDNSIITELFVGTGTKTANIQRSLNKLGVRPFVYILNDIVEENLIAAKEQLVSVGFPEDRIISIQHDVFTPSFWVCLKAALNVLEKEFPYIPRAFASFGVSEQNQERNEFVWLQKQKRSVMRPAEAPHRKRPDISITSVNYTTDEAQLRREYDHYFYRQIFAGGAVFCSHVLGARDMNYDAIGCDIDFLLEKDRIEMNVTNAYDQELRPRLEMAHPDEGLRTQHPSPLAESFILQEGKLRAGLMYRWGEDKLHAMFDEADQKWVEELTFSPTTYKQQLERSLRGTRNETTRSELRAEIERTESMENVRHSLAILEPT